MYISSSDFYREIDEEAMYMTLLERRILTVADVKEEIRLEVEHLIAKYTYLGYNNKKKVSALVLIDFLNKVRESWFLGEKNEKNDIKWLYNELQENLVNLGNQKKRVECDYQHDLSIKECVQRSILNYRKMQMEWPVKEAMEFAVQAKLADLSLQETKINELLQAVTAKMEEIQLKVDIAETILGFMDDDGYFKKLEEDL